MSAANPGEIETYFAGYPQQMILFEAIQTMIISIGPVKVEAMKSGINFGTSRKFAWVWLPQKYDLKQPEGSLVLSFGLDRMIQDPKIKQVVNPYPNRWTHHVVISAISDLDESLRDWLNEAYRFSARGKGGQPQNPGKKLL